MTPQFPNLRTLDDHEWKPGMVLYLPWLSEDCSSFQINEVHPNPKVAFGLSDVAICYAAKLPAVCAILQKLRDAEAKINKTRSDLGEWIKANT